MRIYILALYGSILFFILALKCFSFKPFFILTLKCFSLKPFKIFKINFILILFTFILMVASVFQSKLKIEITTETLILILFNFLVINYEVIITKIVQIIKKIKVGDTEIFINDFDENKKEVNENLKDEMKDLRETDKNLDNEFNSDKKFSIDTQNKQLIFLYYFFEIESRLRRIYSFFQKSGKMHINKQRNKMISVLDIYLTLIRNYRIIEIDEISIELEKLFNVFTTMINLRNILVHHFEDEVITEVKYEELFLIEEKILKNLEIIIKKYNIPKYTSEK